MGKEGVHKIAKVIRDVARIVLLVLAVLLFVFSFYLVQNLWEAV